MRLIPYLSTLTMVSDAVAGIHRGLPGDACLAINRAVTDRGRQALVPIGAGPQAGWVPDCLLPFPVGLDVDQDSCLQALREAQPEAVQFNLQSEFYGATPPGWRAAMDRPQRWITECSQAFEVVSALSRPLWRRARPLVDREIDRVGAATVRGGVRALLTSLTPRMTLSHGTLEYFHPVPGSYDLAGRELILVPMIAGVRMLATSFEDHLDRVWIGYPVPGLGHVWGTPSKAPPPADTLIALLGDVRAAILTYLTSPTAMGVVAAEVGCSPAKMTFHCDRLEAAGLVQRCRRGRTVHVARTDTGAQLAYLYGT